MDNPRPEKVAVVDEVKGRFDAADAAILTEYRGLSVGELATLRRAQRAAGGDYKIYKNTLVRFAAQAQGLDELVPLLVGPTAIAFVDGDAVSVAKALRDFARTNPNLVVKGGLLGTGILTAKEATALADIPPREVLLARLAGGLAAPLQQFAGLLQALPRNLAYGLSALIEKQGGVPEGAAEAPEPTPEPEAAATPETTTEDAPVTAESTPEGGGDAPPIVTDPPNEPRDSAPAPAPDQDDTATAAPDQSEETQQESE